MTLIEVGAIIEILLFGGIAGVIYGLLALGFTLIFGVSGVTNLAHGSFYMLGAYMFYFFETGFFELPPIAASVLAAVSVAIMGGIIYRVVIHSIVEDEVAVMVVTVSLALTLQQIILLIFGTEPRVVTPFFQGAVDIGGLKLTHTLITAFVASVALVAALMLFVAKAKIGKAMRAVSQDREVAMLMGINTTRVYILTMALSAALAALAGIFLTATTTRIASYWMWLPPLALSFSIVILGGLGSIKGSLIGGLIIGYSQNAVAILVPEGGAIISVVPFSVMVLVLLLRPKGFFGKRVEMED